MQTMQSPSVLSPMSDLGHLSRFTTVFPQSPKTSLPHPNLRALSVTFRLDLGSIIKDLRDIRRTARVTNAQAPDGLIQRSDSVIRRVSLVQLLAEEAKFLRRAEVKPSSVIPVLIENLGVPLEGPLGQAALKISLKVEEETHQPDYHNHQHIVEVVVAANILGRREKLPIYRIAELLIAAAAHDLGHTGQNNRHDYERERHSFEVAKPVLEEAGLPAGSIQRIEQMIMATDFRAGVSPARQAYLDTRSLPPLDDRRLLAAQCLLLTEADVLFSCFDVSYNEFLSKLLSAEWKKPQPNLSLAERIGFLSSVRFISEASRQLGLENRRLKLLEELAERQARHPINLHV